MQQLNFHLPNEQLVFFFNDDDQIDNVVDFNAEVNTMFLAWFEANKTYAEDKELTYVEFTTILV